MSAALAFQKSLRARLVSTPAVVALVPAAGILDRNARPAPDPAIILGEDQELEGDDIDRRTVRVVSTVHVWKKETGLIGAKAIAGAMRAAVQGSRWSDVDGWRIADARISSTRFLRDPGGEWGHAVVTVEALMSEGSS